MKAMPFQEVVVVLFCFSSFVFFSASQNCADIQEMPSIILTYTPF